ncbi:SGNH/GDSL hydrolase family protein [Tardiphaga alba]|uniref:SGNH/GDSL hydrolase family protein n=1 Tax=Tardiphaga alba TaxID=340268 RepID=A0ABX8A6M0_9BRAD|nr:SGNH/GDSL hydrolase family protein [Tardiphaga alba]QUS37920.1 SGNH/GDSL hydrolase family protein [Tardiphaga alba]
MSFEATLSRVLVAAALAVTTPAFTSMAHAEDSQAGAQGQSQAPSDGPQRGVAGKAIDRVKEAAKTATDILSRVPCRTPKGGTKAMGTLPHVASKLAARQPVVIVAFGSSSTQGHGSTSPEFNYPNRLAAQLRRAYPGADITVLNRGKGGEDAPEMMARLQAEVINSKPDLVIWQLGTNAVLRNLDPAETGKMIEDGVGRIQAASSDVVLVDPQYSPATVEKPEGTSKMLALMHKVAALHKVGIFPRFEVMKEWHEGQQMAFSSFVIADGLHMNDWGYACFAQLLGDNIIKSVGAIKMGTNEPAVQQAQQRPL